MKKNRPVEHEPHPKFADCRAGDAEHHTSDIADIIERTLAMIGGKWKVLIVFHLGSSGMCRFGELRKRIPAVTQKMLTAALRELEQDGLVERKVYAEVPPRVEYRLTDEGGDLKDVYMALAQWGQKHSGLIEIKRLETADEEKPEVEEMA